MLSSGLWAHKGTPHSLVLIWFQLARITAFQIPNIIPPVLLWPGLAGLMIWQLISHCCCSSTLGGELRRTLSLVSQDFPRLQARPWTWADAVVRMQNIQDLIEPICKNSRWELPASGGSSAVVSVATALSFLCASHKRHKPVLEAQLKHWVNSWCPFSLSRPPDAKKHHFITFANPIRECHIPATWSDWVSGRQKGGWWEGGLTSAGRVISDAPVGGADLSGWPRAMWPDKPLAPESALVGRTQLAPDRPPLSSAQPPRHRQNPLAAATLTSPPGATATSYRYDTQPGTHIWEGRDHAENLHCQTKVTQIHTEACVPPMVLCVLARDKGNVKSTVSQEGVGVDPWEKGGEWRFQNTLSWNMEEGTVSNRFQVNDHQGSLGPKGSWGYVHVCVSVSSLHGLIRS